MPGAANARRPVLNKPFTIGIVIGIVGTLLAAVAVWLTVVYTGAYNLAASDQHADVVVWSFDTTMHRSVASRAGGAELAGNPSEAAIAEDAGCYAESCAQCHGAPVAYRRNGRAECVPNRRT